MNNDTPSAQASTTRRTFLKQSSLLTAGTVASIGFPAVLSAQSKKSINAVIIGIGGRGGGAGGDFQEAVKITGVDGKIVAVADLFGDLPRDRVGARLRRRLSGRTHAHRRSRVNECGLLALASSRERLD